MTSPLVSVIIPTYNRHDTVGRSIESVLLQTYRPMEVIVVDDGSTDSTLEVLEGYENAIRVVARANGGPSAARNSGVSVAKGEIIAFLDSDDTWRPEKLTRQIKLLLDGGSGVPCCVCNSSLMDDAGSAQTSFGVSNVDCGLKEGYWMNPAPLVATRFILFNQVVAIRKSAFEKVGGFKENMRLLEDHDLAFRLALLGPWAFVAEPLVEKYNDTEGVGVQAMRDPRRHSEAWSQVLAGFLREELDDYPDVERIVRRALMDVATEIRAVDLIHSGHWLSSRTGKLLMFSLRARGKIRRRLPSWPVVKAVRAFAP